MNSKVRIAIFASGRGSNARQIYEFSKKENAHFSVGCIVTNKSNAGVLEFAKAENIRARSFLREDFYEEKWGGS